MLEKLMKIYVMAMAGDVRSPLPHLIGPPGCGKSTVVEQLADLLGVNLWVVNLSRLSPLELEGVQMPHGEGEEMHLRLLHATFWKNINEGDIVLFDEMLRAFPEVFNGLLDILTSRKVADLRLPKAFFLGASNTTVAYDKALEDRLLHLPVPDPRSSKAAFKAIAELMVEQLGLLPDMTKSSEMTSLITTEVLPMYEILDQIKGKGSSNTAAIKGTSVRNLIGQAQMREVRSSELQELLDINNARAKRDGKGQYIFLYDGRKAPAGYEDEAIKLLDLRDKLTPIQARNLDLNIQLLELEKSRTNDKENEGDDDDIFNP